MGGLVGKQRGGGTNRRSTRKLLLGMVFKKKKKKIDAPQLVIRFQFSSCLLKSTFESPENTTGGACCRFILCTALTDVLNNAGMRRKSIK